MTRLLPRTARCSLGGHLQPLDFSLYKPQVLLQRALRGVQLRRSPAQRLRGARVSPLVQGKAAAAVPCRARALHPPASAARAALRTQPPRAARLREAQPRGPRRQAQLRRERMRQLVAWQQLQRNTARTLRHQRRAERERRVFTRPRGKSTLLTPSCRRQAAAMVSAGRFAPPRPFPPSGAAVRPREPVRSCGDGLGRLSGRLTRVRRRAQVSKGYTFSLERPSLEPSVMSDVRGPQRPPRCRERTLPPKSCARAVWRGASRRAPAGSACVAADAAWSLASRAAASAPWRPSGVRC